MTTPTTLVMPYYMNAGMLRHYYETLRSLPDDIRDLVSVVIVDDGSPMFPATAEEVNGISLQIYRIMVDVRWNQDAARNIGVNHSETDWVLMTDIDHLIPAKTWESVVMRHHDKAHVYQFARVSAPDMEPYKVHPNTWLMHRKVFDKIGGYDERFAGYYGTDGDFKDRIIKMGIQIRMFKEPIIRVPRSVIPDASTTSYLRKQPEDTPNIIRIKNERSQEKDWRPMRG